MLFIRNVFNLFHTLTGHNCKNHPSFLPTTLWEFPSDDTLGSNNCYRNHPGDFHEHLMDNLKGLFRFDFFSCWNSNVPILGLHIWCHGFQRKLWECRKRCRGDGSRSFFVGKGLRCRKTKAPCSLKHERGGGFKYFFMFIPTWGNDWIWRSYFSNGLKPPTRWRLVFFGWSLWSFVSRIGSNQRTLKNNTAVWATK